jgi:hypothetical protein
LEGNPDNDPVARREVLRFGHEEDVFVADVDERELTRIG